MNRPFSVLALAILLLLVSNQSQAQVCRAYLETPLSTQDFKGLYAKGYSPQVMAPGDFEFPTDRKESLWARLGIQSDRSPLRPPRGFKHQGDLILRNWENRAFKVYYAVAPDETEPSVEEIVIQSLSALPSCKELKQGQVNAAHGRRMSLEASRYLLGEENQFEWGPYILAVEDRKRLFVTKRGMGERNLLDLVESYQVLKEKARKYLASQGTQSTLDQLLIIRDVLAQHGMTRYCRDNATLSILVEGVCANCVGQTLAIIALIKDLGLAIDPNFELAVQVFSDHVRPVLYERQSNRLYDLVYGTSTTVVESILLKPEALLAMSLREKNGFLKNEELEDLNDSKALSLKPQMVKYPGLKLSAEELDSYTINQNPILNTRVDFVNFPFWKSMTIFLEGEPAEQADLSRSLKANWQIQNEQQGSFQGSSPQGSSAAALEASNLFGLSEFIRKQISIYQLHPQSLLESADNFYGKRLVDLVSRLSVYTDKDPRFLFEASQAKRLLSTKQELCDHLNLKCKTSSNVFVGLDDIHTFYLNDKSFGPKGWASSPDASFSFVEKLPFNGFSQGARNLNFNDEESFLKFKSLTLFDRYQWLLGEKQRLEELVVKQWQGRLESKFTAENYFEIYQSEKFHSETQRLIANLSLAIELSIPFQGLTGGSTVLSPQFKDVIPEILSVFVDLRRLAVKNPHTLIKQVLRGTCDVD